MHTFAVDFQRRQNMKYSEEEYDNMLSRLFARFPSFQNAGASAYKPGIANMQMFDQLLGCPHRKYPTVHIAGTNGKGSVSNMLAAFFSSIGLRTALYTSPHLYDFRERMRIASPEGALQYVPKEFVWDFIQKWGETFDHLDLSFFEITTAMAFDWFASENVDIAVIETGLGGRLDSTNIITPRLSVITNIGYDHCSFLGDTLGEIAFEKAGIIKPKIPVVVGESSPETDVVFERKVLYTNLPEAEYMGDRTKIMSLLTFADKVEPGLWDRHDEILGRMDLQGPCQRKNLRTVLAAIDVLFPGDSSRKPGCGSLMPEHCGVSRPSDETIADALEHTASTMDFHGRWEKISDSPLIIADIGHNSHGLKHNFNRLSEMMSSGEYESLTIIFGAMADKDIDKILAMLPAQARLIFVTPSSHRAMKAEDLCRKYLEAGNDPSSASCSTVEGAVRKVSSLGPRDLVYVGGSTYLVSEAVPLIRKLY